MKKHSIFIWCLIPVLFMGCGSLFKITTYDVSLTQVEHPKNSSLKFGETKVATLTEDGVNKYSYEDSLISIIWYVSSEQFNFSLKNKTSHAIRIAWDDIVYVSPNGESKRCIHSGIKLINKSEAQAPSLVAKNSTLSDILVPADNIYYVSGQYGGWKTIKLFGEYTSQEAANTSKYKGATFSILFPMTIEDVSNEYTFEFKLNDIIVK